MADHDRCQEGDGAGVSGGSGGRRRGGGGGGRRGGRGAGRRGASRGGSDGGSSGGNAAGRPVTASELVRWSEALSGIARTGLGFTQSLYERERFEEVLKVAADIRVAAGHDFEVEVLVQEWLKVVGEGVAGYVTPKVAVGAVVGNHDGEILLIQRADSGVWLYPTGWADVGYSASEVAIKEVYEETGIDAEPVRLIAVLDGLRLGFTSVPLYSLVFHCRAIGGTLTCHPLETRAVGWFAEEALPSPLAGADRWVSPAFAAIRGEHVDVVFDSPRDPPWRVPR